MLEFQNLGENVELGMVQRAFGIEPLSLLRFVVCDIGNLCHAIETGLDHLFTGDDLDVYEDYGDGRFHCRSRYYNDFFYYVHLIDQRLTIDEVTARERRKIVFLRRKFLEDLEEGRRIFVRKGSDPVRDLCRLHKALQRHGPHPLLCVHVADADHPVGTVVHLDQGLYRGFVSHFVACNRGDTYDLAGWSQTLRKTYGLTRRRLSGTRLWRACRRFAGWRMPSRRSAVLRRARKGCDGSASSICLLANVLIAHSAFLEADDLLSEALVAHPDHPELVKAYALSAHGSGRYRTAIIRWDRAMSHNPDDPMCIAGFAANLREHRALDRAWDVIGAAVAKFPDDLVVLSEAARIADATSRPADALALWDKAIALHGRHPEWVANREKASKLVADRSL